MEFTKDETLVLIAALTEYETGSEMDSETALSLIAWFNLYLSTK